MVAESHQIHWRTGIQEYLIGMDPAGKFAVVKPLTYMNMSGVAVKQLAARQDVHTRDLLVIYDDLDLPLGKIRFRERGSAGTHRGMLSVVDKLGTEDIPRLRIGIGSDLKKGPAEHFVLQNFAKSEMTAAKESVNQAADGVRTFVREGIEAAMNRFNQLEIGN